MAETFNVAHGDAINDSRFILISFLMLASLIYILILYFKIKRLQIKKGAISRRSLLIPWYLVAVNGALLISGINTLNYFAEHNIILSWSSGLLNRFVLLRPDVIIFILAPVNIIFSVLIFLKIFNRKILLDLINLMKQQRG